LNTNSHLLDVQRLQTNFHTFEGLAKAVENVSFHMNEGETLGLVGESGCGKSVTALSIMRLIKNPPGKIVGGQIFFEGADLLKLSESRMRAIRGARISMIFQEPMTSLNPVYTIGHQIAEMFEIHKRSGKKESWARAVETLQQVQMPSPQKRAHEYPYQLSGGMRQRAMIAMAMACNPKILIADEPTTALDVTIQAQILDLMNKLKTDTGAAILFITHDLGVIAEMAQNVAVMYAGKVMEYTDVKSLYANPKNPYTIGLLQSIPVLGSKTKDHRLETISGVVPSLLNLPAGCLFSDRCPNVFDDCRRVEPKMYRVGKNHFVRCLKYA